MKAAFWRRGLWTLGFALVGLAVVLVVLPFVASTRLVRDRIAVELSAWSGYRVSIEGDPALQVWPRLRAVLTDVKLEPWGNTTGRPAMEAERVELGLSAMAALSGDAVFSSARLVRPVIFVEKASNGLYLPALPGGGRMTRAIDAARSIVSENRSQPDVGRLPGEPLGTVEFVDGRIVDQSGATPVDIAGGLSGKLHWPALDEGGWIVAKGVWRGADVDINLSSNAPLLLIGGGTAPVSIALRGAPASFSYAGQLALGANFAVDGRAEFSTPSLRRLLDWSRAGLGAEGAIGSLSVQGTVSGTAQRLRIENAALTLDGSPGSGLLALQLSGALPVISGTLAFDRFNLQSFLSVFAKGDDLSERPAAAMLDLSFADRVDLDLRLSAQRALVGATELTDVAATARIKDRFAAFDISDAGAFGGRIQAGVRFDRKAGGDEAEIRLLATDIEGGALAGGLGMTRFIPVGRGQVSAIVKGPGTSLESLLGRANGSISASFGPGAISGIDLPGLLERSKTGGFFPLAAVSTGTLPTTGIDLKAVLANGVATIEQAEARTEAYRIILSGIIPYVGRGLALSGWVRPATQATGDAAAPPAIAEFFVGGPWATPFVSPVTKRNDQ